MVEPTHFYPAWALTMAAYHVDLPPHMLVLEILLFALKATLLHSAGCVLNDICDAEFDRQVGEDTPNDSVLHSTYPYYLGEVPERTKNRPLAAGHISFTESWLLFAALTAPSISLIFRMNVTA